MKAIATAATLTLLLVTLCACQSANRDEERVRSVISEILSADSMSIASADEGAFFEEVQAFYDRRDHRPMWVTGDDDALRDALTLFCRADAEGMRRADYANADLLSSIQRADQADGSESVRARAELDVAITNTLMRYASDALIGRVDPQTLDTELKTPASKVNLLEALPDTTSEALLEGLLERAGNTSPQYTTLKDALARYRAIAQRGGWRAIPDGEAIAEGDSGPRVAALVKRLAATGDVDSSLISAGADSARYTADIARGIERFQRRHGLDVDGVAGEAVLERLNVPVEARIRQIELNMERWRWLPAQLGSRYVHVNVPAYELHAYSGGREVMSMAVVVGDEYNDQATPVFSDTMEYVVFNPYWNVPETIAAEEIVPKARSNGAYLASNDYEIVTGWNEGADVVPPSPANLDRVEDGTYRIRQKPGAQNALGRIKFMFPNDFDIYLHDTPEDHLFDRTERAASHGCIRLEHPIEFGEFVLGGEEWPEERIREQIESGEQTTESLDAPLPVFILYWTAFVDGNGIVNFREDIYGSDEELDRALAADAPQSEAVPCEALMEALGD